MRPPFFTQIDVTQVGAQTGPQGGGMGELIFLMRQILAQQEQQTKLLEQLVHQVNANQRQRANELEQWRQANPHLAKRCRKAAEALSKIQTEFLYRVTEEIEDGYDGLLDGEFFLSEFVDRFGPRMAHLNGLVQVMAQLSSDPSHTDSENTSS